MSKNLVFAGDSPAISLPVPAGTRSGDPVKVGGIVGVVDGDRTETVNGVKYGAVGHPEGYAPVAPDGTYSLPVPEAVSAAGTAIYIKSDNTLTTTATDNTLFGHTVPVIDRGVASGATKSADSGGAVGRVNVRIARI
ncbi:capsid cement protein [Nocardioides massiliensis]|uniref:RecA/RadA family phage recombinase n=1 Tax=Nocardioides massiliensis TaxID=1325935 RepID=A0ABT9NJ02_9ACTN|nr:capsid cement protein [Nocardioides massiliensis]MDP9820391.1 putative RecA/RadA family phage recombinase [Nocardioides massiliensis]